MQVQNNWYGIKEEYRKIRICQTCKDSFIPRSPGQKFCMPICKHKENQVNGSMTVANQYLRISGSWPRYFNRLLHQKQRDLLTCQLLLDLLSKQKEKCALSGIPLTCQLQQGVVTRTNASIDKIDPKLGYTPENIQLVCSVFNSWKGQTPMKEFVWFCKQVALFHEGGT